MTKRFGKAGTFYYNIVRGIDDREVQPHRETKSMGAEDTFAYDLTGADEMHTELEKIAKTVHDRLLRYQLKGRTITLKIKYSDFRQITRSLSLPDCVDDIDIILNTSKTLLAATDIENSRIRLLGITVSNFLPIEIRGKAQSDQLSLFGD
jgi:DNA polymerase-4